MENKHDDVAWTCDDRDFQTNTSEPLRQHLKKTGHQPIEAAKRQTNELLVHCYTTLLYLQRHFLKVHNWTTGLQSIPQIRYAETSQCVKGLSRGENVGMFIPQNHQARLMTKQRKSVLQCSRKLNIRDVDQSSAAETSL